jgi:hypothetical protein
LRHDQRPGCLAEHASSGLALGRIGSSAIFAAFILACILLIPQRAGGHPGQGEQSP